MQRLALCCLFKDEPIKFRTTTVRYVSSLPGKGEDPLEYIDSLIQINLEALLKAVQYCADNGIRAFRIVSSLLPISTHPEWGYSLDELPSYKEIKKAFARVKKLAKEQDIRLSFHPDQFVVLSSPREEVVEKSLADLEYHAIMADLLGADVINIHGGGGYGDKEAALKRFAENFKRLSPSAQKKLTVENDDTVYTPIELLPLCKEIGIPLVYDAHHHRCLPDELSIEEATKEALKTWDREPLFHISSPKEGWKGAKPNLHHDFIDPKDVPVEWKAINPLTIDVEAKAKEAAVLKLLQSLKKKGWESL